MRVGHRRQLQLNVSSLLVVQLLDETFDPEPLESLIHLAGSVPNGVRALVPRDVALTVGALPSDKPDLYAGEELLLVPESARRLGHATLDHDATESISPHSRTADRNRHEKPPELVICIHTARNARLTGPAAPSAPTAASSPPLPAP